MAGRKAERHVRSKPQIPRILPSNASVILERCDHILKDSGALLKDLSNVGIAELFTRLDDPLLQLAIQPDSWGERTRARLMSDLVPALSTTMSPGSALNIEDVVRITNAVTPCLLLELGRRKGHIQVEFPLDPSEHNASFGLSVSPTGPMRRVTTDRISRIVEQAGEALVGLCYFGDTESREIVEALLTESAHA